MACVREAGWVCGEKIERTVCVPGRLVVVFSACYQGWRGERGWAAIMRSFVFPCSGEGGSTLGSLGLGFSVYTTGWVGGAGPRDPFTAGGGQCLSMLGIWRPGVTMGSRDAGGGPRGQTFHSAKDDP